MNLPVLNSSTYNAAGRHIVSYAMGAATMLGFLHLVSPDDAQKLSGAITNISSGVATIFTILGPLFGAVSAWLAARAASPAQQAQSLVTQVPGTVVITAPNVAENTKSNAVVSNETTRIVPKDGPVGGIV